VTKENHSQQKSHSLFKLSDLVVDIQRKEGRLILAELYVLTSSHYQKENTLAHLHTKPYP